MPSFDRRSAAGRTRRLIDGAFSAMLSKGVALVANFVSIPIAIRYLGAESFGVWVTISSGLSMLLLLDLGVANSLTNFISDAYARDDREHASAYSTTALALMLALAAALGAAAWLAWPLLNWERLFRLSSAAEAATAGRAVAAALCVFLFGLPAGLAAKILGGYQELRYANLFVAGGSLLNLAAIAVLVRLGAGLAALVAASSAALVGANLLCLAWIWWLHKPWLLPRLSHVSRRAASRMMRSGSEFFIMQVSSLAAFNSDNLVLMHYLGPAQVASYSFAWRLTGFATIAQSLLAPALWPAFAEAFARGDLEWVRRTFRRMLGLTMGIALVLALVFAAAGRRLIRLWAGSAAVPGEALMLLMCAWIMISIFMGNTANILMAKGETRLQAWCALGGAAANLALSIYWVRRIGAPGVILATIVSFLAVGVVPQTWKCIRILQGRSDRTQTLFRRSALRATRNIRARGARPGPAATGRNEP